MVFGVSLSELTAFHKDGGEDRLQNYGGVSAVAHALEVDVNQGPSPDQVSSLRATFGENRVPEKPPTSYLMYLWMAGEDFTIRLLCACAVFSIIIALAFQQEEHLAWLEGVAILGTVVAVCNIQAIQDYSKERSFRKLNADVSSVLINVKRAGVATQVVKYDLVVGDVVSIAVGDVLEADGIILFSADIEMDESALTGEPEDIKKGGPHSPFLCSGTSVKNGSGAYLVTAVGINSISGKITALIRGQEVDKGDDGEPSTRSKSITHGENDLEVEANPKLQGAPTKALDEHDGDKDTKGKKGDEKDAGSEEEDGGVLRGKLDLMVGRIAIVAFSSAGIASFVILARFIVINYIKNKEEWDSSEDPESILDAIVTGIAIVVVAVPEGLPLAVTLALTLSMKKMQTDNNLVKHLDATETMGSATTICSDKTGTLTQNRMTVVRASLGGQEFVGDHSQERTCGKLFDGKSGKEFKDRLVEAICLSADDGAEIRWDTAADRWEQKGNKTECALLAFAHDLGVKAAEVRARDVYQVANNTTGQSLGLKMFPFSSSRKRSGIAVPLTAAGEKGPCRLYLKGASEIIMRLSSHEATLSGSVEVLGDTRRDAIFTGAIEKFASSAMRTLALAYRDFPSAPDWEATLEESEAVQLTGQTARTFAVETGLTFLGVMGIHDPIRDGVPRAITQCNLAGVDVRMVTGDHKATAIAIAKECGILRKSIDYHDTEGQPLRHRYTALTGDEFRKRVLVNGKINQEAFDRIWPHLRVLARSSPEDKHTLVTGLCDSELFSTDRGKALKIFPDKQVVAVTGDGTNDAPALRKAHVGFAMKITGTRVAQDAADILLLDDNFESVVKACMWGRNVYDSIAKFLQFQLTVNVSAVSLSLLGAVAYGEAPLSVVQMLWVNLIMDSLGALALASERPTEDLLHRPPYGKNKLLISYEMAWTILGQSVYQLVILVPLLMAGAGPHKGMDDDDSFVWVKGGIMDMESGIGRHDEPSVHYTLIFNCFVFMQLFNWINCRKLHFEPNCFSGIQHNVMFCVIWATCAFLQTFFVQVAAIGGGDGENVVFKTKGLDGVQWLVCLGCGVVCMLWQLLIIAVGTACRPKQKIEDAASPKDDEDAGCDSMTSTGANVVLEVKGNKARPMVDDDLVLEDGDMDMKAKDFEPTDSQLDKRIGMLEHQVCRLLANRQTRLIKYLREFGTERAQQFGSTADEVLLRSVFKHWQRRLEWASRSEDTRQLEVALQAKKRRDNLAICRRREMTAVTVSFWGSYVQEKTLLKSGELSKVFLAWYFSWLQTKDEWVNRLTSSSPVGEYVWYIMNNALLQDSGLLLAGCFWQMVRQTRHAKRSKAAHVQNELSVSEHYGNQADKKLMPTSAPPDVFKESTEEQSPNCCGCTNV